MSFSIVTRSRSKSQPCAPFLVYHKQSENKTVTEETVIKESEEMGDNNSNPSGTPEQAADKKDRHGKNRPK